METQNSALPTTLCDSNPPMTNKFPSQKASEKESIAIPKYHHKLDSVLRGLAKLRN